MSATYTHHLFTKDVYKSLHTNIKIKLDPDIFDLFGKSFDVFFFYKPKIGTYLHNNHANLYFANIVHYLRSHKETHNSELLSYLYGSICHYVLDSIVHPFIYYYGGKAIKNNPKTYKYRGKHDYIELMIDAIMCEERNHKKIQKCNIKKQVFPKVRFTSNLSAIINQVYFDTFQISNAWKLYYKSYRRYRWCFKYFMSSRFGIKKMIYKFVDKISKSNVKLQHHCYYVSKRDDQVLNLNHQKWYYPVDKKISYHYSFFDLYDVAVIRAVKLITLIDEALDRDDKRIKKVIKEIGNLGYATGVNENRVVKMKYFAN